MPIHKEIEIMINGEFGEPFCEFPAQDTGCSNSSKGPSPSVTCMIGCFPGQKFSFKVLNHSVKAIVVQPRIDGILLSEFAVSQGQSCLDIGYVESLGSILNDAVRPYQFASIQKWRTMSKTEDHFMGKLIFTVFFVEDFEDAAQDIHNGYKKLSLKARSVHEDDLNNGFQVMYGTMAVVLSNLKPTPITVASIPSHKRVLTYKKMRDEDPLIFCFKFCHKGNLPVDKTTQQQEDQDNRTNTQAIVQTNLVSEQDEQPNDGAHPVIGGTDADVPKVAILNSTKEWDGESDMEDMLPGEAENDDDDMLGEGSTEIRASEPPLTDNECMSLVAL
ncbi:uncharacterized protein LAESUDRAFT_710669 [Laetiporus sulphureus 93-53]|uniref:Uncharacterized protein n=1 Tax=Laetiporus sulphureus 93-53 TaxID=1314785 RepID=A0A165HVN3_9APHY|nr:uncharacterized protein LAESUDRAFT_710669 [Laetiporus sulphureus 93-53]KZT12251.1 hypothetical protein LAESUDRAFT_710669 [Laetiporus sulphureus 93-53]